MSFIMQKEQREDSGLTFINIYAFQNLERCEDSVGQNLNQKHGICRPVFVKTLQCLSHLQLKYLGLNILHLCANLFITIDLTNEDPS